jgi:hypothetical protein
LQPGSVIYRLLGYPHTRVDTKHKHPGGASTRSADGGYLP